MRPTGRGKRGRKAFWKKSPEIERVSDHIGRAIDRLPVVDTILNIGLAYLGYELTKDWKGALIGPIALKLATANNIVAGGAGIATLAFLGLTGGGALEIVKSQWQMEEEALRSGEPLYNNPIVENGRHVCEGGYLLMERAGVRICVDPNRKLGYIRWGWKEVTDPGIPQQHFEPPSWWPSLGSPGGVG